MSLTNALLILTAASPFGSDLAMGGAINLYSMYLPPNPLRRDEKERHGIKDGRKHYNLNMDNRSKIYGTKRRNNNL